MTELNKYLKAELNVLIKEYRNGVLDNEGRKRLIYLLLRKYVEKDKFSKYPK